MMADPYVGTARAALGQGLGMGWGDEAEAWLRSKLSKDTYENELGKVRSEYGQYSQENPVIAGASEMLGGAAPGVALMMVPGGQAAGAQQVQRSALGALSRVPAWAKLAGAGGVSGAVSGAGSAEEGNRGSGAFTGGVLGTTLGVAVPAALRGTSAAGSWLRERLAPTEALIQRKAAEKMSRAMAEDQLTPQQLQSRMAQDRAMGVPSVLANTNPALADLAEAVAQRTGAGTRKIEKTLAEQKLGARERTHQQTVKGMNPGDYYADLESIQKDLRTKAAPHYEAAYATGEVTDPEVLKFMELPQFKQGLTQAKKLLEAEGRKLPVEDILDAEGKKIGEKVLPNVETLDQVKRGLDALIEKQTDPVTGKVTSLGRVYTQKKNEFLNALDAAVPEYGQARAVYRGDAELADAMRKGINDFGKMDHEQVIKLVSGMSDAEKQAFRTGVARDMYDKIMKPSGNFNAAQRVIGSPEMQAKLQPLFDSPAQFDLFKNALERESQLFNQSTKILSGSPTAKRQQMQGVLEDEGGVGAAVAQGVLGGWKNSLLNAAVTGLRKGRMTDKTSAKLADMLMSKDPHEVAAVVKMLEEHAAGAAPKAARASALEGGATTGTATAVFPSPAAPAAKNAGADIEADLQNQAPISGPDIEADLEAESRAK